jgi:hypothetical protein
MVLEKTNVNCYSAASSGKYITDVSGQLIGQGSRMEIDFEDGTGRFTRNVGNNLPLLAA